MLSRKDELGIGSVIGDERCTQKLKGGLLAAFGSFGISGLERLDALCLPTFGSLYDGKLHRLTFFQAAETVSLNCRKVHENIFAVLAADESVAFRVVEPLHCTLFHSAL